MNMSMDIHIQQPQSSFSFTPSANSQPGLHWPQYLIRSGGRWRAGIGHPQILQGHVVQAMPAWGAAQLMQPNTPM